MHNPPHPKTSYSGTVPAAEESHENFNIPSKRHQELLHNLSKALGANKVPAPFWACLQVCDLSQLEVIVNNAHHAPFFITSFAKYCSPQIPLLWLQEDQETDGDSVSSSSISTDSGSSTQDPCPAEEADERDGSHCVFKRLAPTHVAYIYPNYLIGQGQHTMKFWDLLLIFWSTEKLQHWKGLPFRDPVNPIKAIDACYNHLYMSPEIY